MSNEFSIVLAVLAVLVLAGVVWLVTRRSGGRRELPPAPPKGSAPVRQQPPSVVLDRPGATGELEDIDVDAELAAEEQLEAPAELEAPVPHDLALEPPVLDQPVLDRPELVATRWQRLRARLASSGALGGALLDIFSRGKLSAADWEEIEETLLLADLGLDTTTALMEKLRQEAQVLDTSDPTVVREILRRELLDLVGPNTDRSLDLASDAAPAAILVVGVNGTGKTTTVGKLARVLVADGHKVILGAADTFRAAAADQLSTWGERVGVEVVRADRDGADPASVAYEAVEHATKSGADVVIVDTAGRLQNKTDLMDELGKIKRVMGKGAPVREVLLVLDATTGQNGLKQAEVFAAAVDVTGIVLTKLDGTAKGGIVVAAAKAVGAPVKFVGLGEGPDDLAPFNPADFVDALVS